MAVTDRITPKQASTNPPDQEVDLRGRRIRFKGTAQDWNRLVELGKDVLRDVEQRGDLASTYEKTLPPSS